MFLFKILVSTVWLCTGELYREEVAKPVLLRRRSSLGSAPYSRMFSSIGNLERLGAQAAWFLVTLASLVSDISPRFSLEN